MVSWILFLDDYDELESKKKPLDKGNQFDNQLIRMGVSFYQDNYIFPDSEEKSVRIGNFTGRFFLAQNEQISVEISCKMMCKKKLGLAEDGAFYTNLRKQYRNPCEKMLCRV